LNKNDLRCELCTCAGQFGIGDGNDVWVELRDGGGESWGAWWAKDNPVTRKMDAASRGRVDEREEQHPHCCVLLRGCRLRDEKHVCCAEQRSDKRAHR
jgi:hypothetical protein